MKKVEIEIIGIVPLLQNRFRTEEQGASKSRSKKKVYVPEEEAEKALYKDSGGMIYVPSEHLFGCLLKASTNFIFEGKKSFKDIIKAGIIVEPDAIPLNKKTWDEIDARPVVIQRSRVIRWRPKFNDWKLTFSISIIDDQNLDTTTLKEILERAGTIGIGDYRPRYGRFMVSKFNVVENGAVSKQ